MNNGFQLNIVSNGHVALYRTLLSVWKLEIRPNLVSVVTPVEHSSFVERSIATVSEDLKDDGPTLEISTFKNHWNNCLNDNFQTRNYQHFGFLVERDMLLPGYAGVIKNCANSFESYSLIHFQRKKFGNSTLIIPKKGLRSPLSALILSRGDLKDFFREANIYENFEYESTKISKFESGNLEAMVLVQSNTKSAFGN